MSSGLRHRPQPPDSVSKPPQAPFPYGFTTERLVVRCYEPADAEKLLRTLSRSQEHLSAWLAWASDLPGDVDESLEWIRRFRGQFDTGADFIMGIFSREDGDLVGGTGLHPRVGPGALEIGYWVASGHTGQGLVTESTRGLVRLGFEYLLLDRIEIRMDPKNLASRRVPERLGFDLDGLLPAQREGPTGAADVQVWSMTAESYASRPGEFPVIQAWDAGTRPVQPRAK